MKRILSFLIIGCSASAVAYPTDKPATDHTGMRRLEWQRAVDAGERKGSKTEPGAHKGYADIKLHLLDRPLDVDDKLQKNKTLQAGLEAILKKNRFNAYNVALLDITDPKKPRYAAVNEVLLQTPGSVAKLLGATALLSEVSQQIKGAPAREQFLRETLVTADGWLMPNTHEVPVVNGDKVSVRAIRTGDTFSLYEWLDHALSPSSNAAGTLVWREATLMRLLGGEYPPAKRDAELYNRWTKAEFTAAAFAVLDEPEQKAGVPVDQFYLRLFFTRGASRYLDGAESRASPRALVQWMTRVEQGRMVNPWVSLELKRLMYLTRRRIRYVYAKELNESAAYFKSGSLYQCNTKPCAKYRGDKVNVLNALVEIESPEGARYIVAVMSNELRRNAANDHAVLAGEIHALVTGKTP